MTRPPPLTDAELSAEALRLERSKKYKDLAPETIADVLQQENRPGAAKAKVLANARLRLHRVAAHYLGLPKFNKAQAALTAAFASGEDPQIEAACRSVLETHSSTQERLPHLRDIFDQLFQRVGMPESVLDLACAVQPLAWRFTGLPRSTMYTAVDISQQFIDLIRCYFQLEKLPHQVLRQDVFVSPVTQPVDLALLWKMYHCLEQRREGAGLRVVETTAAKAMAISFPTRSLAGKRMRFHEKHGPTLIAAAERHRWRLQTFEAPGELFHLIQKPEWETPR